MEHVPSWYKSKTRKMVWTYYVIIDDEKYSFTDSKELIISDIDENKNEKIIDISNNVFQDIQLLHYKQSKEKEKTKKLANKNKSVILPDLSDEGRETKKSAKKYNL